MQVFHRKKSSSVYNRYTSRLLWHFSQHWSHRLTSVSMKLETDTHTGRVLFNTEEHNDATCWERMKPEIMSSEISRLGSAKSQMLSLTCEIEWGMFGKRQQEGVGKNKRGYLQTGFFHHCCQYCSASRANLLKKKKKEKNMAKVCYIFYSTSTAGYSGDEMAGTNLVFEEAKTNTRVRWAWKQGSV